MEDLNGAVIGGRGEEGILRVEVDGADGTGVISKRRKEHVRVSEVIQGERARVTYLRTL